MKRTAGGTAMGQPEDVVQLNLICIRLAHSCVAHEGEGLLCTIAAELQRYPQWYPFEL